MKIVIINGNLTIDPGESAVNIALFNHCLPSIGDHIERDPMFGVPSSVELRNNPCRRQLLEHMLIIHGYGKPIVYWKGKYDEKI
jgi:hypothetical protein